MSAGSTPEKPAVIATRARMRIHAERHATRAGKPGFTGYMGPGTDSLRDLQASQETTMRPWLLAETNYEHTKEHRYEVAVLPFGATEPHNLHLPYGMDQFEGTIIGEAICGTAHDAVPASCCCRRFRTARRPTCSRCRWP